MEQWINLAEDEGAVVHNSLIPEAIQGIDGKRVSRIDLRQVKHTRREKGGKVFRILGKGPGSTTTLSVDHLIIATGQKPDLSFLGNTGVKLDRRGAIRVDTITQTTSVLGIFAAGDVAGGPRTITDSIAAGRRAAYAIDNYLQGKPMEDSRAHAGSFTGDEILPDIAAISKAQRVKMQTLSVEERIQDFREVDLGFNREEATREADRCMRCKTCLRCVEATHCVALLLTERQYKHSPMVDGLICAGCGWCARECPYHNIHLA
jgi:heterodisulfide reductase subunit A